MARWIFTGSVRLDGVSFVITAGTKEEAIAKAKAGDYDEYDDMGADAADWKIDSKTGQRDD